MNNKRAKSNLGELSILSLNHSWEERFFFKQKLGTSELRIIFIYQFRNFTFIAK